jgi:diketogulonate reductase-like aldo/keto reductase
MDYKLNDGYLIPKIGFGTWEITPDSEAKQATLAALGTGYRLIDTAKIYGNEKGVGEAIRESGIPREQLFVTTKLWNDDQGYDSALKACRESLERLGLDYLDLYLIHWPATPKRHDAWRAFEKLQQDGIVRSVGVSNYTVEHLEELMERSELIPAVNQVEFHPFIYNQQLNLLDFCAAQHIIIEAYSPLRRLKGDDIPDALAKIAERFDKTPQQIILRWCVQQGTVPLPRSTNPEHIQENFEIFDFELTKDDMLRLDSISDGDRVTWDPAGMG